MRVFLRRPTVGREPLAVAMSGVRMGERVLQIGVDDPLIAGVLAAKTGITGQATIVVADESSAERARGGAADAGALVDVLVAPLQTLPLDDGAFDVVIIHSVGGLLASLGPGHQASALRECWRVLRPGGRALVLAAGMPTGFRALLGWSAKGEGTGRTVAALQAAGLKAVRPLGDRQGYCFIEGLKV